MWSKGRHNDLKLFVCVQFEHSILLVDFDCVLSP